MNYIKVSVLILFHFMVSLIIIGNRRILCRTFPYGAGGKVVNDRLGVGHDANGNGTKGSFVGKVDLAYIRRLLVEVEGDGTVKVPWRSFFRAVSRMACRSICVLSVRAPQGSLPRR